MKSKTRTEVRYEEITKEIEKNIIILQKKMEKHQTDFKKNPSNWGFVGDITHINEKLVEVIVFLGN